MTQRRYRIFMVNPPPKVAAPRNPQQLNEPQRDTPIATLAQLNAQSFPTNPGNSPNESKPERRSIFIRRDYKRSLSAQPQKYSYNLNHISKESDFLDCNILECYIVDREPQTKKQEEERVERDSKEEMKKFIDKVEQSKKKREEWKNGNVVAGIQESTVIYHAQFKPYQDNLQSQQQKHTSKGGEGNVELNSSPEKLHRKRVSIFDQEVHLRPNSYLLETASPPHPQNPNPVQSDRKRAVSLDSHEVPLSSFLAVTPEAKMSTIREQPSQLSSRIHEQHSDPTSNHLNPALHKLFCQE